MEIPHYRNPLNVNQQNWRRVAKLFITQLLQNMTLASYWLENIIIYDHREFIILATVVDTVILSPNDEWCSLTQPSGFIAPEESKIMNASSKSTSY